MHRSFWAKIADNPLLVPLSCLGLVLLFNLITNPGFFDIAVKRNNVGNWILAGNLSAS